MSTEWRVSTKWLSEMHPPPPPINRVKTSSMNTIRVNIKILSYSVMNPHKCEHSINVRTSLLLKTLNNFCFYIPVTVQVYIPIQDDGMTSDRGKEGGGGESKIKRA